MKTARLKKFAICFVVVMSTILFVPAMNVSAMHIMEGYLAPGWCISEGALLKTAQNSTSDGNIKKKGQI